MTTFLFSYGTLQYENVQITSFGRILKGTTETLKGYKLSQVKITDASVLEKSAQAYHPIAIPTTNQNDEITGTLYEITQEELAQADAYEVADYKRIAVTFVSNKKGWVYVQP